jgi:hypothetical protein
MCEPPSKGEGSLKALVECIIRSIADVVLVEILNVVSLHAEIVVSAASKHIQQQIRRGSRNAILKDE